MTLIVAVAEGVILIMTMVAVIVAMTAVVEMVVVAEELISTRINQGDICLLFVWHESTACVRNQLVFSCFGHFSTHTL